MRIAIALILVSLSGCLTGMNMDVRRDQALRAARFDHRCDFGVVDEQPESREVRYRLSGCGKTVVYVCSNVNERQRDSMDVMMHGSYTPESSCRQIGRSEATQEPDSDEPRAAR